MRSSTRELKNANFGFTIGAAPLPAKKSTGRKSKTPQPLPPRRSTRKTPPAAQDSTDKTPAPQADAGNKSAPRSRRSASASRTSARKTPAEYKTPTVTGKRKRTGPQEQEGDELEGDDEEHRHVAKKTFATPATRQSPAAQGASASQMQRVEEGVDEREDADVDHTIASNESNARLGSAVKSATRPAPIEPTATPSAHASKPGQITTPFIDPLLLAARKSTAKSRLKKSMAEDQENVDASEIPDLVASKPRTPLVPVANMLPLSAGPSPFRPPTHVANDISPLFQPGEQADAEGSPIHLGPDANEDEEADADGETDGEDELTPAPSSSVTRKPKSQGRRKSATAKPSKAKPRPRTKAKPAHKARQPSSQRPTSARRQRSSSSSAPARSSVTVPIAVYRPTKLSTLYSTQAPDADPLGAEPIPSLNAVDVLAQICGEITRAFIDSYDDDGGGGGAGAGTAASRKRQRGAVARFHGLVQDALFGLTSAVGAGAALARGVKVVRRRTAGLREELGGLRAERESVRREMEMLRAEYVEGKEKTEREREASALAFEAQGALAKYREAVGRLVDEDDDVDRGLLVMRDDVMAHVGAEAGLLARVKALNDQMEKMAESMEQRQ